MGLFNEARNIYDKVINGSISKEYKRWGRFALTVPFVVADIGVSKDKTAAVSANVMSIGAAWAMRNQKGILPFIVPWLAYGTTRMAISGSHNKAANPIKGHDAGHWGRDQTFASGDFEPGSSWKGSIDEPMVPSTPPKTAPNTWKQTSGKLLWPKSWERSSNPDGWMRYNFIVPGHTQKIPYPVETAVETEVAQAVTAEERQVAKWSRKGLIAAGAALALGAVFIASGRNKPYDPVKGHDKGHWGRDQIFSSGDFTPGSSYDADKDKSNPIAAEVFGLLGVAQISPSIYRKSKEMITGRAALFHGSTKAATEQIRQVGLRTEMAGTSGIITGALGEEFANKHSGLLYLTKSKKIAATYAAQAESLAQGNAFAEMRAELESKIMFNARTYKSGITEFNIPLWKIEDKLLNNPELEGYQTFNEYFNRPEGLLEYRSRFKEYFNYRGLKGSVVLGEDVGPQFIKGNPLFNEFTREEFSEYAKRYPGRIAKGIGLGLVGLGVFGAISYLTLKSIFSNKAANPIKGHDAGHWGREQTFASGDFEPGSSWKGLFGAIGKIFKSGIELFRSGVFKYRMAKATRLYSGLLEKSLAGAGVNIKDVSIEVRNIIKSNQAVLSISAVRGEESLAGVLRRFSVEKGIKKVEFITSHVAENLRGTGIGRAISAVKTRNLYKIGYGKGTLLESSLTSPKTARWWSQVFGPVKPGPGWAGSVEEFNQRLINREFSSGVFEELGGATGTAVLPSRLQLARRARNIKSMRLKSNKPLNPIKGHDAGHLGREITFSSGDFRPGESWKGIFEAIYNTLMRPVKFMRAVGFNRKLALGARLYKSQVRFGLGTLGAVPESVETIIKKATSGRIAGSIELKALGKGGQSLMEMTTNFTPGSIELESVEIADYLQNSGFGSFLKKAEPRIFARMGYKPGTLITSPIVNPATGKLFLDVYGGTLKTMEQEGLYAQIYGNPVPEHLVEKTMGKRLTKEDYLDFGGATGIGKTPTLEKMEELERGMRWGQGWAKRTAEIQKIARQQRLNILQEQAQPLPFKLNANRRGSHGIVRPARKK